MALPDVSLTIRDFALGVAAPSSSNVGLKVGCAPMGVVNSIYSVSDNKGLQDALGKGGPLVEAAALSLAGGGPLYCVPVNPSTYGTASSVTKIGTGTPAVTVAAKPSFQIVFKVTLAGSQTTGRLAASFDGGVTYQPDFLSAATVQVPGASFVTIAIGAGTLVAGDTYTLATTGAVTTGGGNTGTCVMTTSSASVVDAYSAIILIAVGGALGVGSFKYSLDGGNVYSGSILIPASGTYVIPDSGLVLTFASGTYVAADQYVFTTTAPSYTTTDFANAMTPILADARTWFMLHVVGAASTVSAAATFATSVDSQMATAASAFRFARAIVECPSDTDANIIAAFAAFASTGGRTLVAAGFAYCVSPLNGRILSRNAAWFATARAAKVSPSRDIAAIADGAVLSIPSVTPLNVKGLVRDETATPGLDSVRFVTLRSMVNYPGFYITNGRSMALDGSDYTYLVNGRVMDILAATCRTAGLVFLNGNVRVTGAGTIDERDAQAIEAYIGGALRSAVVQPGYASDVSVVVNRSANILSTGVLPITARCVPLGYSRQITIDLGFSNPALTAKAA